MSKAIVFGGRSGIGQATVAELHSQGYRAFAPQIDVTEPGEIRRAIKDAITWHSTDQLSYAVFSVGVNQLDWSRDIEPLDMLKLLHVNVVAFAEMIKHLQILVDYPMSVVAVSSDAGFRPMRTSLAYCASKAALTMAARVAARELTPEGWRINTVSPGKVADTPMTEYVDSRVLEVRGWTKEHADAYEKASSPLGMAIDKRAVARLIVDVLTSPVAAWTGQDVVVNGGR